MSTFLKENIAIVIGIALPLLLMVFFFVAGKLSVAQGNPPQYSAVFVTNYNENTRNNPWRVGTNNNKIFIRHIDDKDPKNNYHRKPEIYVFNHQTLSANRVDIDFENIKNGYVHDPDLDTLNQKKLIAGSTSPDGYNIQYHYRSSGRGIAGELFGFGRRRSSMAAVNMAENQVFPIKNLPNRSQGRAIAWIQQ